jgi:hypothetical protein
MRVVSETHDGTRDYLDREVGLSGDMGMELCIKAGACYGREAGPSSDVGAEPRVRPNLSQQVGEVRMPP